MKRRGFLGRLLALPAAAAAAAHSPDPFDSLPTELRSPYPTPELDAVSEALVEIYPPEFFEERINETSAFLRHIRAQARKMALHNDRMIMGIRGPDEEPEE